MCWHQALARLETAELLVQDVWAGSSTRTPYGASLELVTRVPAHASLLLEVRAVNGWRV